MINCRLFIIVTIISKITVILGQDIDFYQWSQLIDENLVVDYFNYISKFRTEIDANCAAKMLLRREYAECYYDALRRWRYETPQEKLACCFIHDYEYCMLELIKSECGTSYERKYRTSDGYKSSKRHMMSIFNCYDKYYDIDNCRLPVWGIILIAIGVLIVFATILCILKCRYNAKHRKRPQRTIKRSVRDVRQDGLLNFNQDLVR